MSENPRVQFDLDETLDDFMATDVKMVHFEAIDQSQWYATIELNDGRIWQLGFGAVNERARGFAHAEELGRGNEIQGGGE